MQQSFFHRVRHQRWILRAMVLLASVVSLGCGGGRHQGLGMHEGETKHFMQDQDSAPQRPAKNIVLAFLGFVGHKSCFTDMQQSFANSDASIEFIYASPEDPRLHSGWECCTHVDAYTMQHYARHLGLGGVQSQARAARAILQSEGITDQDQVILLGHSQGGLAAVAFYEQYKHAYTFKGVVTTTAPLQGVQLIDSLSACDTMCTAAQMTPAADCCTPATAYCCACFVPSCVAPCFLYGCGPCCCPGITDMAPHSRQIQLLQDTYTQLQAAGIPLLAVTAQCPAAEGMERLPYGKEGTQLLLSGASHEPNDGLVATKHQVPPTGSFTTRQYDANHGVATIPAHPRIFSHPTAIKDIVAFCQQVFGKSVQEDKKER